jgi:hypothetical protein
MHQAIPEPVPLAADGPVKVGPMVAHAICAYTRGPPCTTSPHRSFGRPPLKPIPEPATTGLAGAAALLLLIAGGRRRRSTRTRLAD